MILDFMNEVEGDFTPLFCSYFFFKRRSIVDTMTDFKEKMRIKEQVRSRSNLIHKVYCLFICK